MAILNTGKSFANGEQLTADKLNQVISGATFNIGAVDSGTMAINSEGKLAVNQISTTNIPANAVEVGDLAQVATNTFLGRTASGTGNVSAVDISSIATLLRPSGTVATGGTTQTNGEDGGFNPSSNRTNLNRKVSSGTSDVDFEYNINEFTGTGATDFHYSKITGIVVRFNSTSDGNTNTFSIIGSQTFGTRNALGVFKDVTGTNQRVKIQLLNTYPIAADERTFTIRHVRNDDSAETEHSIVGFTYMPNLPEVTF